MITGGPRAANYLTATKPVGGAGWPGFTVFIEQLHWSSMRLSDPRNLFLGPLLVLLFASCGGTDRAAYSFDALDVSGPTLVPTARFWADSPAVVQKVAFSHVKPGNDGRIDILSLSGGGPDGAFGAGLLTGWTETGKRPVAEIVTGVSISAIIAPIAFLGPEFDEILSLLTKSGNDGFQLVVSPAAVAGMRGVFSPQKVRSFVERIVTPTVVAEIIKEHDKGRRLFVATSNIDAQRMAIWDIGD